jgi:hypothetical protein
MREDNLSVHFSQCGLAHLLLSIALPCSCVEHGTLFELFARILDTIACNDLKCSCLRLILNEWFGDSGHISGTTIVLSTALSRAAWNVRWESKRTRGIAQQFLNHEKD